MNLSSFSSVFELLGGISIAFTGLQELVTFFSKRFAEIGKERKQEIETEILNSLYIIEDIEALLKNYQDDKVVKNALKSYFSQVEKLKIMVSNLELLNFKSEKSEIKYLESLFTNSSFFAFLFCSQILLIIGFESNLAFRGNIFFSMNFHFGFLFYFAFILLLVFILYPFFVLCSNNFRKLILIQESRKINVLNWFIILNLFALFLNMLIPISKLQNEIWIQIIIILSSMLISCFSVLSLVYRQTYLNIKRLYVMWRLRKIKNLKNDIMKKMS